MAVVLLVAATEGLTVVLEVTFVVGVAVAFTVALVVDLDVAFEVGVGVGFLVAALALPLASDSASSTTKNFLNHDPI